MYYNKIKNGFHLATFNRINPKIEYVLIAVVHHPTRSHENHMKSFCLILLIDKLPFKHLQKHNVLGVGNGMIKDADNFLCVSHCCWLLVPAICMYVCTLCFKKRHPFYFCENAAKYYQISIIFGSSIPEEICNKNVHVYPPHLFTVLIPYLVKIMIHLPVFTLF